MKTKRFDVTALLWLLGWLLSPAASALSVTGYPLVYALEAPSHVEVGEHFGIRYRYDDPNGLDDVAVHHVWMSDGTRYTHAAGGSGLFYAGDIWYFDSPGLQWIEVFVEDTLGLESNHLRQTIRVGSQPDLVPGDLELDHSRLEPGQSFTLAVTVRNAGSGAAAATTLRFYLSRDDSVNGDDTLLGSQGVDALTGGASSAKSLTAAAPMGEGNYWVGACVDPVADELDTGNNCTAPVPMGVYQAVAPELQAAAPLVDIPNPLPAQGIRLTLRVRNSGSGGADATRVRFYLSNDTAIDTSDSELGNQALDPLGAGSEAFLRLDATAPDHAGAYWLGACVEAVAGEADPANNCSAGTPITVVPAVATGLAPRLAADDRQVALAVMGGNGDVIVYSDRNGHRDWDKLVLNRALGGPAASGPPDLWFDPKDGRLYVASPSTEGLILYQRDADSWSMTNLTRQAAGEATALTHGLGHFITPDLAHNFDGELILDERGNPVYPLPERDRNNVNLTGLNAMGDLVLYRQQRDTDGGATYWAYVNITKQYLLPDHQEIPQWATSPIGYATPWNGQNVAGLDAEGRIIAVWTAPDRDGHWATTNLSASYGTPPLAGGLSAYVNWGINLTGILPGGRLGVTWWSAQLEQERKAQGRTDYWAFTDLSVDAGGPTLRPETVTNYTTPNWPSNNIAGITDDNELVVYWWTPSNGEQYGKEWMVSHLSRDIPGARVPGGPLGSIAAKDGTTSIIGLDAKGEVLRYFWSEATGWRFDNASRGAVGDPSVFGPKDDGTEAHFGAALFGLDGGSEPAVTAMARVSFDPAGGRVTIRDGSGVRGYELSLMHDAGVSGIHAEDGGYIANPSSNEAQTLATFSWSGEGTPALGKVQLMRYDGTPVPVAVE